MSARKFRQSTGSVLKYTGELDCMATRWLLKQGYGYSNQKDVDLIVRSNVVEEDDDLNEGFCHYSIIDDE